jgi:hypothetical protein
MKKNYNKEKQIKDVLKILPTSSNDKNSIGNGVLYINSIFSLPEADGDVVLNSSAYQEVFRKTRNRSNKMKKRLAVVKITANGAAIHRSFRAESAEGFTKNYVGLTPSSLRLLNDKDGKEPEQVTVMKGCYFLFYWSHPDKAIRISFKLGLLGVLLGLSSFMVSVISLI